LQKIEGEYEIRLQDDNVQDLQLLRHLKKWISWQRRAYSSRTDGTQGNGWSNDKHGLCLKANSVKKFLVGCCGGRLKKMAGNQKVALRVFRRVKILIPCWIIIKYILSTMGMCVSNENKRESRHFRQNCRTMRLKPPS
jgi:hypothetical protein